MDARKSLFTPNTPIRYAPKTPDTWSFLPEMVAFKDPLNLDIAYHSSLESSEFLHYMFSASVAEVSQKRSNVAREIRISQGPQNYDSGCLGCPGKSGEAHTLLEAILAQPFVI